MKIIHVSDTHGAKYHCKLQIPECDVLIHTGDIGGRTNILELAEFLIWFEAQPAKKKIWIGGNHDICLDRAVVFRQEEESTILGVLAKQAYMDAMDLIQKYDVKYLNEKEYIYEGVKFWGSPYTPSFHRNYWAFNADRGAEIQKRWAKIPSDVNVLLTHGPVMNIFDECQDNDNPGQRIHVGCQDLADVIKRRLFSLKLHCSGHIHDQVGVAIKNVSDNRRVMFSNGAVVTNEGKLIVDKPLIITI